MPTSTPDSPEYALTADMLLFNVELQDALGTKDIYTENQLLAYHNALWLQENPHSTGMMPASFPVSDYIHPTTGEVNYAHIDKLAQVIKVQNERKKQDIAPAVQAILEEGRSKGSFI